MRQRTIIAIAVVAVLLANIDYGIGFFNRNDLVYTGVGGDYSVYVSLIAEAAQGHFFFHNFFTNEPQNPRFIQPLWFFLGRLSALLSIAPALMMIFSRMVAGFFFLLWIGNVCNRFFRERLWATVTFFLVAFSSGIGAFLIPAGRQTFVGDFVLRKLSPDLWQDEMNTFTTLMHSSLFIATQMLLLFLFLQWLAWEKNRQKKTFYSIIIATFVLASIHPYDAVLVYAVLLAWIVTGPYRGLPAMRRVWWGYAAVAVSAAVPMLAHLFLVGSEIALAGWMAQNITIAAPPLWYLSGYGLLLPLALWGLYRRPREEIHWGFFFVWICVALLLLFFPSSFQRRFVHGLHIPLAFCAALGLRDIFLLARKRFFLRFGLAGFFFIGLFGTTFYRIGEQIVFGLEQQFPAYVPAATLQAIRWIGSATPPDAIILAAPMNGNVIPPFALRRVYFGHSHQTIDSLQKRAFLYDIFFSRNDDDRMQQFFFRNEGIGYLLWTPLEQKLGNFRPEGKAYLREVYRNGDARVYAFVGLPR